MGTKLYGAGLRVNKTDLILRCDNKQIFDTLLFKLIKSFIICHLDFQFLQDLDQFIIRTEAVVQRCSVKKVFLEIS